MADASIRRERKPDQISTAPSGRLCTSSRVALIAIAVVVTGLIAIGTHYRAHPDEYYHVDAFQYFEEDWWPPDLNSNAVIYSPQGWSRVYTGEIVYLLLGAVSRVVQSFWSLGDWAFLIYRVLNVALFSLTLVALFFTRCRWVDTQVLGLVFVCIPQVHYLYAYANSDAFGLSVGVLLFLLVAVMMDRPSGTWTWSQAILLGTLTGLILVSKKPYLLSLMLPYALLGMRLWHEVPHSSAGTRRQLLVRLIIGLCIAAAIAVPLRIVYPLTQGDFAEGVIQMREERAAEGFKPSNPTYETHRLASKGEGYRELFVKRGWLALSFKSFYGLFGYMNVPNPAWVYAVAGLGAVVAACMTTLRVTLQWADLPGPLQSALALSPLILLSNIGASMAQSLYVGFQPQGRYLFPSLIPVSLMLSGGRYSKLRTNRLLRKAVFGILYLVCLYSLVATVLLSPKLSRFS